MSFRFDSTRTPDVVVIGAGLIGLSIALELNARGANVTVVDRGQSLAGASTAAAGMLAANDPGNPPELHELSRLSAERYPAFLAAWKRSPASPFPSRPAPRCNTSPTARRSGCQNTRSTPGSSPRPSLLRCTPRPSASSNTPGHRHRSPCPRRNDPPEQRRAHHRQRRRLRRRCVDHGSVGRARRRPHLRHALQRTDAARAPAASRSTKSIAASDIYICPRTARPAGRHRAHRRHRRRRRLRHLRSPRRPRRPARPRRRAPPELRLRSRRPHRRSPGQASAPPLPTVCPFWAPLPVPDTSSPPATTATASCWPPPPPLLIADLIEGKPPPSIFPPSRPCALPAPSPA